MAAGIEDIEAAIEVVDTADTTVDRTTAASLDKTIKIANTSLYSFKKNSHLTFHNIYSNAQ